MAPAYSAWVTHPEVPPVKPRRLVDLAPLRTNPVFARLWIGSLIAGIGAWMSVVAVGLQIYAMTASAFAGSSQMRV